MKSSRVVRMSVVIVAMLGTSLWAQAKPQSARGNLELRVSDLEMKNQRMKQRIRRINQRLKDVERYLEGDNGGQHPPGGGDVLGMACVLIDTGYGRPHVGTASTSLDAEYKAHKACEDATHDSYCTKAKVECEPITSYSKSVCVLTDKGYGNRHRGEGDNEVLAKASAIKQCNDATHDSYCVGASIKCETVY